MIENSCIPWEGWQVSKRLKNGSYGTVYEIQRQIYDETESVVVKTISILKDISEIAFFAHPAMTKETTDHPAESRSNGSANKKLESIGKKIRRITA